MVVHIGVLPMKIGFPYVNFFGDWLKPNINNGVLNVAIFFRMHVQLAAQRWVCWLWMSISNGVIVVSLHLQRLLMRERAINIMNKRCKHNMLFR